MNKNTNSDKDFQHPKQLLKLQKLKLKKKALQERINGNNLGWKEQDEASPSCSNLFSNIFNCKKRKNPFAKEDVQQQNKKSKSEPNFTFSETSDQTLYKLLNPSTSSEPTTSQPTSFANILSNKGQPTISDNEQPPRQETHWCPIDWTLKKRLRLISLKPFPWTQKLKISEECSGLTSFTRCLDIEKCDSTLDTSPNAKFHQCCLYWQQPNIPWLSLFPRHSTKSNLSGINLNSYSLVKNSLYESWTDGLKSLYQLIRMRQCPYFYVCANSFTALFRAAGLFGYTDPHVMVSPTTRGFRKLLKEDDIEFEMPLKQGQQESQDILGEESETRLLEENSDIEDDDEDWLSKLGVNADDIKNINYTQNRIQHKTECQVDSTDQSLILIQGVEVNSFFNFLLNCKSTISPTGSLAGIPPTLLAPVAFYGATLSSLKVRENKMHMEGTDYHTIELSGPILPSTIQNIFNVNPTDHNIMMTFNDIENTKSFSKVTRKSLNDSDIEKKGTTIFGKENLSDCGLNQKVLNSFCSADVERVTNVECLKYSGETSTFSWS